MPKQRVSQEPDSASITNDKELNAGATFNDVAGSIYNNVHGKLNDTVDIVVKSVADIFYDIFNKLAVSWKNTDSPDFKNNPQACANLYKWWCTSEFTRSKRSEKPAKRRLAELMNVHESTARGYIDNGVTPTIWAAENLKYSLLNKTGSQETYYDIIHGRGAYSMAKEHERKKPYIDTIQALTNEEALVELETSDLEKLIEILRVFLEIQ